MQTRQQGKIQHILTQTSMTFNSLPLPYNFLMYVLEHIFARASHNTMKKTKAVDICVAIQAPFCKKLGIDSHHHTFTNGHVIFLLYTYKSVLYVYHSRIMVVHATLIYFHFHFLRPKSCALIACSLVVYVGFTWALGRIHLLYLCLM